MNYLDEKKSVASERNIHYYVDEEEILVLIEMNHGEIILEGDFMDMIEFITLQ